MITDSFRNSRQRPEDRGDRKDKDRVWHSNKSVKENVKAGAIKPHTRTDIASVQGARKAPMPEQLKPALATLVDVVPNGSEWLD